jgi:hypothetical protein
VLAALVLAGLIAVPIGTAGLLVQSRRRAATAGAWPAVRRFTLAIGGTVVLAAIVVASLCSPRCWPAPICGISATRSARSAGGGG